MARCAELKKYRQPRDKRQECTGSLGSLTRAIATGVLVQPFLFAEVAEGADIGEGKAEAKLVLVAD